MIHLSQTNNDFDALVFNHRNQAYGAYVLRREYPKQVLKSLLIGVAIIASILAIPYLAELLKKEKVENYTPPVVTECTLTELKEKEEVIPPELTQRQEQPSAPSQQWNIPLVVDFTTDTMPTAQDLTNPASITSNGDPDGWGIPCPNCLEEVGDIIGEKPEVYPYYALEEKPQYKGGEEAMWQFLKDNLNYPQRAKENGIEGKVYVTFVIDQFGTVTKAQVPREVDPSLDEEALRVVKMMPRWKPGRQAGHPVSVSYQLPIIFQLD